MSNLAHLDLYLNLAPTNLRVRREDRYDGGGFSVSLTDLALEDVSSIIQIYQAVKRIYDLWLYMRDAVNYDLLRQQLSYFKTDAFLSSAQAIGTATYAAQATPSTNVRKAIHDIRGGALASLIGYCHLLDRLPDQAEIMKQAVYLARDHAKMMRNIVPDLDIPVRAADESSRIHGISDFVEKWNGFVFEMEQKQVQIEVGSHFDGFITNRCLETSAVDRILYNYINNAARFAATDKVRLTILPVNQSVIRWVVENEISNQQRQWLTETLDLQLDKLFAGGYTRGGHGVGLSSCVSLVAASFGVTQDMQAVQEKYLGAALDSSTYYAWFHWPSYVPESDDEPMCECED